MAKRNTFREDEELEEQIMADLAQPYVQGLTLLGESPFSIRASSFPWSNASKKSCLTRISGLGQAIPGKK